MFSPAAGGAGLVLGAIVLIAGLLAPAAAEASFDSDGNLDAGDPVFGGGDPVFNRPLGGGSTCILGGPPVRYDTFTTILAGEFRIEVDLGTLTDSVVVLYRGSFNPAAPCANFVAANDDGGPGFASQLVGEVDPGTYVIVVTGFTGANLGTYTLEVVNDLAGIVTAAGPGGGPHIRGFDAGGGADGAGLSFFAYPPGFTGGVFVATGFLPPGFSGPTFGPTFDDSRQIITGAGPGGATQVRAFNKDGSDFGVNFTAYPGFTGSVRVAACDVTGGGTDEIITAAGPGGGPHVRVWSIDPVTKVASVLTQFFAYNPAFVGGVFVACGPVAPGGTQIITGADAGGGPQVSVWQVGPGPAFAVTPVTSYFAYPPSFTGGVRVAVGNVDGTGLAEIITGAGPGGGPHVVAWRLGPGPSFTPTVVASFFAYDPAFTGGVFVAAGRPNGNVGADVARIITAAGAGGGPHVRIFDASSGLPVEINGFFAYTPLFTGGVTVAGGRP